MLAFGPREYDESVRFPRLGMSLVGGRLVDSDAGDASTGCPAPVRSRIGARPARAPVRARARARRRSSTSTTWRPSPSSVRGSSGSGATWAAQPARVSTGLQHVDVAPGKEATAQHCHSVEEEIFVILDGDGVAPSGGGGDSGARRSRHLPPRGDRESRTCSAPATARLVYLAYGTRDPGDVCYYPRSNKIAFRGVGVIARLEQLDYWDGED